MQGKTALAIMTGALLLGGCASQRSSQEISRLKSDVGLLDQRVTQLERASLAQSSPAASWPSESTAQPTSSAAAATSEATATTAPVAKPSKKDIQSALKNAGLYKGPVDGRIGGKTREAVREFQRIHGLKIDGVVGKQTWEKLSPYLAKAVPEATNEVMK